MSDQTFINDVVSLAQAASAKTGVRPSVIIAQWCNETGFGTSEAWNVGNNFAGVSPGGVIASYPNKLAGLQAYIDTMNNGYYNAVKDAGKQGAIAQAEALGRSPWAASHYGNPPGSDLVSIIEQFNLTQYDTGTEPTPSPLPTETDFMDNETFLRFAYRIILHREIDPGGFATFMAYLSEGGSRGSVWASLQDSPEGQKAIAAERKLLGL